MSYFGNVVLEKDADMLKSGETDRFLYSLDHFFTWFFFVCLF